MGFHDTINNILSNLPKQRRTGLFSATQSAGVVELIRAGLRNPVTIKVRIKDGKKKSQKTPLLLDNYFAIVPYDHRVITVIKFINKLASGVLAQENKGVSNTYAPTDKTIKSSLQAFQCQRIIVFFSTCAAVDFFYKAMNTYNSSALQQLKKHARKGHKKYKQRETLNQNEKLVQNNATNDYTAGAKEEMPISPNSSHKINTNDVIHIDSTAQIFSLHGKMDNKKRIKTLSAFQDHNAGLAVLFCTDLAARGLDIPNVDWIVQFDAPLDPDFFVHRVGRTARAGHRGKALVFLSAHEKKYCEFLRSRKVPIADYGNFIPAVSVEEVQNFQRALRAEVIQDRDLMDKSVRAFVSNIRAYREHRCRHIFRVRHYI